MEDRQDADNNDSGNSKAPFKLLEVKNTPKKKGKQATEQQSAEKADGKEKDGADAKENGGGADHRNQKKQQNKVL